MSKEAEDAWRAQRHRDIEAGIGEWLEDVATEIDEEDLRDEDSDLPWTRPRTGVDRYRAWSDYYDMRRLPSGRWEATCRKCGRPYTRGDAVATNGRVYKTGHERVMDLVETHIMRGCDPDVNDSSDVTELPLNPPF